MCFTFCLPFTQVYLTWNHGDATYTLFQKNPQLLGKDCLVHFFFSRKEPQWNWSKKKTHWTQTSHMDALNLGWPRSSGLATTAVTTWQEGPNQPQVHRLAPCHFFFVLWARRVFGCKPTSRHKPALPLLHCQRGDYFWYHRVGFGTLASVSLNTTTYSSFICSWM